MEIKVLGVIATPVKGPTNTEFLVQRTMDACVKRTQQLGHSIKADIVNLADKKMEAGCIHCNWCLNYQTANNFCSLNDDMKDIYPLIAEADGLIFGTPVYIGRLSWLMAAFIDRMRALGEGRYYGIRGPLGGVLQDKVIAAASVAWVRYGGVETAMLSTLMAGMIFDAIITTGGFGLGVGAVSASPLGQTLAVSKDRVTLSSANTVGRRVAERCLLVKAGKKALRYLPAYL